MWVVRSSPRMGPAQNAACKGARKLLCRFALPAIVFTLAGLESEDAFAQAWPQANPYIQPAPSYVPPAGYAQQPNYAAPGYGQADGYGQQGYPQQPYAPTQQPYGQQAYAPPASDDPNQNPVQQAPLDQQPPAPIQALDAQQLEQLVAPIALYPDMLVAQVLAAATYPAQVVAADHWRQSMGYSGPDQIVAEANVQQWDPSVKALTAFPQVLSMMDGNIQWTTDLGNAYYNQPQDVLATIQVMRQRAQAAGTLQSSPWESVSNDQGYVELAPANPAVVYVPSYNPWDAYGQPVPPYSGFSLGSVFGAIGSFVGSGLLHFGPGIAMSAFRATPWGALAWGLDWLANNVLFNHSAYYSRSTTVAHWNLPARMPRGYLQQAYGRPGEPFNRDPRGNNWGGNYGASRPQPVFRQPDRFAGNRSMEAPRPGYYGGIDRNGVRPGLGNYRPAEPYANRPQPYAVRPQEAYNHQPEPIHQNYGSGFRSPQANAYAYRSGGFANASPAYRSPVAPQRNNELAMGRSFTEPQFRQERSGGFHMFGGGEKSEFKAPRMPKNFGHEKMPKAPHFSEHSHGGGHSGGGHFFGGHHR